MSEPQSPGSVRTLRPAGGYQSSHLPITLSGQSDVQDLENLFIGISGLIGAGKSTLCTALGAKLGLPCYYEPVIHNEYLEDFYKDQKTYAFPLQVYLLNKRFKQQQQIIWSGKGGVQDRTIYEDSVFARMLKDSGMMSARDYRTYCDLFSNMSHFMCKPNIIIHLHVTPKESMDRIAARGRDCESGISLEYLEQLYNAYEAFIREISRVIPVIKVNYSEFHDVDEMAEMIKEEYAKLCNVRLVEFNAPK
mmetsp:Transcript_8594/g.35822  ORF Transcript_8594/g.35822 Transcript_8594/m.35822 type:complete len:249 (+) Transcript_8594:34-780(+)